MTYFKYLSNYFLLFILLGIVACSEPVTVENKAEANIEDNMDWMLGEWERVDEVEGKRTYESWKKNEQGQYLGHGLTTLDVDTIFEEYMKIYRIKDDWVIAVAGINEEPTVFSFINKSNHSFAANNAENEFPKKIEYFLEQDFLRAVISDDITKIPFKFRRVGFNQ